MSVRVGHRNFNVDVSGVHKPINPLDVYDDSITGVITDSSSEDFENGHSVKIITISPVGAEFDLSSIEDSSKFYVGCPINVKISINKTSSFFYGLLIAEQVSFSGKKVVGIRWCETPETKPSANERRNANRWLCSDAFLPDGIAPNPSRFNDFIYFKVLDLSKSGMQITTSMRNKLLIPGMVFDSSISLPLIGETNISFKIENVRIKEESTKDMLVLGVTFLKPSSHFYSNVAQYLLQFGRNVTPSDLKLFGLVPKSINSAIEYSYVKDADTYKDILFLRRKTYTKNEILNPDEDLKWADFHDSKSRIIVAKHLGKSVGTVRLTFHGPGEPTEYHDYATFPKDFPNSSDLLVSGRLCTDPNYRGSDLFDGLIRQMVLTGLQSKRKYILGSARKELCYIYERIGLNREGILYSRSEPEKVELEVLCMDIAATIVGRGIKFKWWRRVYRDLHDYIYDYKDFEISPLDRLRLKTFVFVDKLLTTFGL